MHHDPQFAETHGELRPAGYEARRDAALPPIPPTAVAKVRATTMAHAMKRLLTGRHGAPAEPVESMWPTDGGGGECRLVR